MKTIVFSSLFYLYGNQIGPYPKQLQPFIKEFAKIYQVKIVLPIELKPMEDQKMGICLNSRSENIGLKIIINSNNWKNLDYNQKEQLIFHELGHCVLKKFDHNTSRFINHCPKSIMHPYTFTKKEIRECYLPNRQYYINELRFKR